MILSENIGFSFCSPALSQTSIDILTTVVRNTKPPLSELLVCQAFPVVAQCTLRTDDNAIMQVNKTKTKRSRNNYVKRGHFNCVICSMWCNKQPLSRTAVSVCGRTSPSPSSRLPSGGTTRETAAFGTSCRWSTSCWIPGRPSSLPPSWAGWCPL